jgi:hypothetical protein
MDVDFSSKSSPSISSPSLPLSLCDISHSLSELSPFLSLLRSLFLSLALSLSCARAHSLLSLSRTRICMASEQDQELDEQEEQV